MSRLVLPKLAILLFLISLTACSGISPNDPSSILKATGLDIANFEIEHKYDNLDRTASAWDDYTYILKINHETCTAIIPELDKLAKEDPNWEEIKTNEEYRYEREKDFDFSMLVHVNIGERRIYVDYMEYESF